MEKIATNIVSNLKVAEGKVANLTLKLVAAMKSKKDLTNEMVNEMVNGMMNGWCTEMVLEFVSDFCAKHAVPQLCQCCTETLQTVSTLSESPQRRTSASPSNLLLRRFAKKSSIHNLSEVRVDFCVILRCKEALQRIFYESFLEIFMDFCATLRKADVKSTCCKTRFVLKRVGNRERG